MEKTCPDCLRTMPTSSFAKTRKSKDGLYTYCRQCSSVRKKAYRSTERAKEIERAWRMANRDTIKAKAKARSKPLTDDQKRRQQDRCKRWRIINAEKSKTKKHEYYEENKKKILTQQKAYYEANKRRILDAQRPDPEENVARVMAWRKANPEKFKAAGRRCREKLSDGYIRATLKQKTKLKAADIPQSLVELKRAYLTMIRELEMETNHEDR